ncbi:hypothetical protein F5887DRAFT_1084267 [Amanita rubescens]|nr:hypothetical protein F5887DRAFT_1084267 [Amanita rubescens]
MQAAGRALEQWETGEFSEKAPKFSADNYGDIVTKAKGDPKKSTRIRRASVFVRTLREMNDTQWNELMINAHQHLKKLNKNMIKSRDRATSAATLVEEDDEEDPDGDFVMVLA